MKLAPFGRSDSHSVRVLRAVKSHPCGAGLHSNGRGAVPVLDRSFSGGAAQTQYKMFLHTSRGVKCGACCEVCGSRPTSFARLPRMPVEDLRRRFRVSLICDVCTQTVRRRASVFLLTPVVGMFVPHASRASLVLYSYFKMKQPRIGRKIFSSYAGPLLMFATRGQSGAAEGATQKEHGNTGKRIARARRSPPGSSCGPLFICAAFFSPAPRPRAGMSSGH